MVSQSKHPTDVAPPTGVAEVLFEAKLSPARLRPGIIARPGLVDLLITGQDRPLVVFSAPVGYGKGTLLAEWARTDRRTFAWVSLAHGDGAAVPLFTLVARALGRALGTDAVMFKAETPGISVIGQVVPRVVNALQTAPDPLVLVIHNIHEVCDQDARDAVDLLLHHLPPGVQLAVSSRRPVWLATPARRARAELLELGPDELAFTSDEVGQLLALMPGTSAPDDLERIMAATEGWPAGVYLSLLSLRRHRLRPAGVVLPVTTAETAAATIDFIKDEVLSELQPDVLRFLRRAAVLDAMTGALCDTVLHMDGADRVLQSISRSNLLVVPIDAKGSWYRCHTLLRTALLDELAAQEPDMVPVLHERAAAWWEAAGSIDAAIRHALAAGHVAHAAELAARDIIPAYYAGRLNEIDTWLAEIGDAGIEANPTLSVLAGWIAALTGRSAEASHWLDRVEHVDTVVGVPPDAPSLVSNRAALRGFLCADGVEQMAADAELSTSLEPPWSPLRTVVLGVLGTARWMQGDRHAAVKTYTEAIDAGTQTAAWVPLTRMLALRAVLQMDLADWDAAAEDIERSLTLIAAHNLADYGTSTITHAAAARLALHGADIAAAHIELSKAMRLRDLVTWATPWASVILRLQLIDAHLALGDPRGARIILREVDDVLHHRPRLGLLNAMVEDRRRTLSTAGVGSRTATLTTAELRLLPYLQTHLTLAEIAERLYISRNTVATESKSIYQKLGASTRSEGIRRAREVGLLPPSLTA
jgi:LuxR family transcriptional regulator, maltose regulon positive regulatory protein